MPLTSLEQDLADAALLRSVPGRIEAVRELDPVLLEVEVSGLEDFAQVAPDTFVYVMVDTTGRPIDPAFDIQAFQEQGLDGPVRGAYYTVRSRDPYTGRITFWVVRHDGGAVADWIAAASPGDGFVAWGPRPGFDPPEDAEAYLLVADETGYAAVAAIVESARRDVEVVAILECGEVEPPPMPPHPRLDLRVVRRSGPPGSGDEVLEAVASLDLGEVERWVAFGGAESHQVTRVRRLLRHERGLPADRVLMTGYWRATSSNGTEASGA